MGSFGSGKSTFYDTLLSETTSDFIHIDMEAKLKEKLEEAGIKHIANQLTNNEAINEIQTSITKSQNIVIETTFASTYSFEDIEILKEFKNNGYEIEGYFLYTDDVEKNINNKLLAYLRGDSVHIDDDTIIRHYNKSLENIEKYGDQFDKLHLIDNSNLQMQTKKILENENISNINSFFSQNDDNINLENTNHNTSNLNR